MICVAAAKVSFVPLAASSLLGVALAAHPREPSTLDDPRYSSACRSGRAMDAIGRPDASLPTLRHSTATAILATGESLDMVGDILGTFGRGSTRQYAHRQLEHMAAAMGKLAE